MLLRSWVLEPWPGRTADAPPARPPRRRPRAVAFASASVGPTGPLGSAARRPARHRLTEAGPPLGGRAGPRRRTARPAGRLGRRPPPALHQGPTTHGHVRRG